jgi:hypothetical protein
VFLVIIGLFLLNGIAVLFANQVNDKVAYNAARAAANAGQNGAEGAARNMISRHPVRKPIIQDIKLAGFNYLPKERVEVTTQMTVGLPAPLPCFPKAISFQARSIQAVVVN